MNDATPPDPAPVQQITMAITMYSDGRPPHVELPVGNLNLAFAMLVAGHQALLMATAEASKSAGPVQPALIIPGRNGHTPNLRARP